MAKRKPLHMGKSLSELNAHVTTTKVKSASPKNLCQLAEKIFLKARDERLSGDEENSYILFMRFLDVANTLKKSDEYKSNKKEFDQHINPTRFREAIEEAENLSRSLKDRYAEHASEKDSTKDKKVKLDGSGHKATTLDNSQVVPSDGEQLLQQILHEDKEFGLVPQRNDSGVALPSVSVQQLFRMLNETPDLVLVLDCRARASYTASHTDLKKCPQWLSVPEELILKGLNSSSVASFLSEAGRKLWSDRSKRWIVLADEESTVSSISSAERECPIKTLKDSLYKWDTSGCTTHEPLILQGGYSLWCLTYGPWCVGQWKRRESSTLNGPNNCALQPESRVEAAVNVEYPSFPAISPMEEGGRQDVDTVQEDISTSQQSRMTMVDKVVQLGLAGPNHTSTSQTELGLSSSGPSSVGSEQSPSNHIFSGAVLLSNETPIHSEQGRPFTLADPAHFTQQPPPPLQSAVGLPFVDPGILPPPSTSTIPFSLSLEGEAALLTPMLSSDDHMTSLSTHVTSPANAVSNYISSSKNRIPSGMTVFPNMDERGLGSAVAGVQSQYHQSFSNQQRADDAMWNQPSSMHQFSAPQWGSQNYSQSPGLPNYSQLMAVQNYEQMVVPQGYPAQDVLSQQTYQPWGNPAAYQPPLVSQTPPLAAGSQPVLSTPGFSQAHSGSLVHQQQQVSPQLYNLAVVQPGIAPEVLSNPRVAVGPIPEPPTYSHALHLPSHAPVQPPIPPPMAHTPTLPQTMNVTTTAPSTANQTESLFASTDQSTTMAAVQQVAQAQIQEPSVQPAQPVMPVGHEGGHQMEGTKTIEDERKEEAKRREEEEKAKQNELQERIKDLERRLSEGKVEQEQKEKERMEVIQKQLAQVREEHKAGLLKVEEEHRMRMQQEREQSSQALNQQKQEVEATKRRLDEEVQLLQLQRLQFDKEKEMSLREQQRPEYQQLMLRQQEDRHMFKISDGLPPGWEKRLDRATGRFYYLDHGTHTTHWNPPTNWVTYQADSQRAPQSGAPGAVPNISAGPRQSFSELAQPVAPGIQPVQPVLPVPLPPAAVQSPPRGSEFAPSQPGSTVPLPKSQLTSGTQLPGPGQPPLTGTQLPGPGQPPLSGPGLGQPPLSGPGLGQPPLSGPGLGQPPLSGPGLGQPPLSGPRLGQPPLSRPGLGQPPLSGPGLGQPPLSGPGLGQPPLSGPGLGQPPLSGPGLGQPPLSGTQLPGPGQPPLSGTQLPGPGQPPLSGTQLPGPGQPPRSVGQSPQSTVIVKPPSTPLAVPIAAKTQPAFDRSTKPRRKQPAMSAEQYRRRVEALQPVFGALGPALTGLKNLGNTCFMNSTLQCLSSTGILAGYFITGKYAQDINYTNPFGMGGEIAEQFGFLVKSLWSGQYKHIAPREFKSTIGRFAQQFSGTSQQDSQEFLAFLMDGLHEDLNRVEKREYIEEEFVEVPDKEAAEKSWKNHRKRNDSIIVDLFQGQFRSTITCRACGYRSVTFDAFMYLSVPLPSGSGSCSLESCINLFTKEDLLTGDNKWVCVKCKQPRDAYKRIEIWKLPPILLIHLKRFSFEGMWREKRQNLVDFKGILDMSPYVIGAKPSKQYSLYAISNHYGTISGGHYTAYCMNPYKHKFYCFDDHEVHTVETNAVVSSAAYLLFYTTVEFTPPSLLR